MEFVTTFPTEAAADAVAREYLDRHNAGKDKLGAIETRPGELGGMELVIVKQMLMTYEGVASFESQLAAAAHAHGGRFDGWEVMQAA